MRTFPVNQSDGPFVEACDPARFISIYRLLLLRSVRMQKRLDGASLVHGPIAFSHLIEGQSQIENLAGIDLAVQHQIDQFRQVATNWSRSTVKMNMRVEQLLAIERDIMRNAYIAHVTAGARGFDRLHHGFLSADAFENRVSADSVRQFFNARNAVITSLGDDVSG